MLLAFLRARHPHTDERLRGITRTIPGFNRYGVDPIPNLSDARSSKLQGQIAYDLPIGGWTDDRLVAADG